MLDQMDDEKGTSQDEESVNGDLYEVRLCFREYIQCAGAIASMVWQIRTRITNGREREWFVYHK